MLLTGLIGVGNPITCVFPDDEIATDHYAKVNTSTILLTPHNLPPHRETHTGRSHRDTHRALYTAYHMYAHS